MLRTILDSSIKDRFELKQYPRNKSRIYFGWDSSFDRISSRVDICVLKRFLLRARPPRSSDTDKNLISVKMFVVSQIKSSLVHFRYCFSALYYGSFYILKAYADNITEYLCSVSRIVNIKQSLDVRAFSSNTRLNIKYVFIIFEFVLHTHPVIIVTFIF